MYRPRIAPHHHTGRRLHRHHTSYAALVFMVLVTTVTLMVATTAASAYHDPKENPQTGHRSVSLSGTVRGQAPTQGAVIVEPDDGQRFSAIPITVRGTCPKDTVVSIFKNDVFAGATVCENGGFSLQIDLFAGRNALVARVFDALNQSGPDSNTVVVFYDPPGTFGSFAGGFTNQLVLKAETYWHGVNPGNTLIWPVEIIGGKAPYAVSWDWGDRTVDPVVRQEAGVFEHKHIYSRPGNHYIIIRATDSAGQSAYLQLVAVVNGATGPLVTQGLLGGGLAIAWPLLIMVVMMIVCFFLGEKWERRHERHAQPALKAA